MNALPFAPRAAYAGVPIHSAEPDSGTIRLTDNTLPFGVPPSALATALDTISHRLAGYPTAWSSELREAFAAYVGVRPDEVLATAGSDEAMSCAFRALADPGASVAMADPTFVMTRLFAITNSLNPTLVPVRAGGHIDVDGLVRTRAALTVICTPNNPTGLQLEAAELASALDQVSGTLIIDEAYAEFAGTNIARLAPAHGRLVVYRTMSKAFGMAGFRVGFAVADRRIIRELEKARGPFTVSTVSERAAQSALASDQAWMRRGVEVVAAARDRLMATLRASDIKVPESAANFVLVPVSNAIARARDLAHRGILVRPFNDLCSIGDALRVTVGTPEQMQIVTPLLLDAVR
ncbi:MAG: pyridoxal phosphate-dependent aminotransferase [Gemmatimonadota bacterium]